MDPTKLHFNLSAFTNENVSDTCSYIIRYTTAGKMKNSPCGNKSVVSRALKKKIPACLSHRACFESEKQTVFRSQAGARHAEFPPSGYTLETTPSLPQATDEIVFSTPLRSASAPPAVPSSPSPFFQPTQFSAPAATASESSTTYTLSSAPEPLDDSTRAFLEECSFLEPAGNLSYEDMMKEFASDNSQFSLDQQQAPPLALSFEPDLLETVKRFAVCRFKIPQEDILCSIKSCGCKNGKIILMLGCQHFVCASCYLKWKQTKNLACPTCNFEHALLIVHRMCE